MRLCRWLGPILFWCAEAHAEGPTQKEVTLHVEFTPGTEACPNEVEMRQQLAAKIGYDPVVATASSHLRLRWDRSKSGFRANLTQVRPDGATSVRDMDAGNSDCGELATSVALALALAIDPVRLSGPPKEPEAQLAKEPPAEVPRPKPTELPPSAPKPLTPSPLEWVVTATPAFAVLSTPSASFSPRIGAGVRVRRFEANVEGLAVLPGEERLSRGTVRASILAGILSACFVSSPIGFAAFRGCALFTGGRLLGEGSGVSRPTTTSSLYFGSGVHVGVEARVMPSFAVEPFVEGLVPITRTKLRILENDREVDSWTTPAFGLSLGIHARLLF